MPGMPTTEGYDGSLPGGIEVPGYTVIGQLGQGSFGAVFHARRSSTGEEVAVKVLPETQQQEVRIRREIENHSKLKHPNIVCLQEVVQVGRWIALVMDYVGGGDLYGYMSKKIQETGRALAEDTARELFRQLVRAVEYMHHQGVVSRDIKLDNLLVDTSQEPPTVKLCDFGFSKSQQESSPKSRVGSPQYLPPEVILHSTYDGHKADIWNCGVVLYAMVSGSFPFQRMQDMQLTQTQQLQAIIKRVVAGDYVLPEEISPECGNMIANLLAIDPVRRLGLSDIQRHVFFVKGIKAGWFEESAILRDGKRETGNNGGSAGGSSPGLAGSAATVRQTAAQIGQVFDAAARAPSSSGEYVDPLTFNSQVQLTEEEEELLMDADLDEEEDC